MRTGTSQVQFSQRTMGTGKGSFMHRVLRNLYPKIHIMQQVLHPASSSQGEQTAALFLEFAGEPKLGLTHTLI